MNKTDFITRWRYRTGECVRSYPITAVDVNSAIRQLKNKTKNDIIVLQIATGGCIQWQNIDYDPYSGEKLKEEN